MSAPDIIANDVIEEFMRILKRNGFLSYHLKSPTEEIEIVVPGEKRLETSEAFQKVNAIVIEGEEIGKSDWESGDPPQNGVVLIHIDQYEASLVVPVRWEHNVRKLLSEYLSLKYLMMDIPEASAETIARECARRMGTVLNKASNQWGYATPYAEFVQAHMDEFNQIMVAAIATPSGLPVKYMGEKALSKNPKLRVSFEGVRISEVQWPYRLDAIRFLDEENHLLRLDWQNLLEADVANRMYDIDDIQDVQHVISRTMAASLLASMENKDDCDDPHRLLEGHLEFINGHSDLIQPTTYQEFLSLYAKHEQKTGGPGTRLRTLIQPWKGTPPRGVMIKWRSEDEPYLVDPSEYSKKRNKRSFNRSAPVMSKRHRHYKKHYEGASATFVKSE